MDFALRIERLEDRMVLASPPARAVPQWSAGTRPQAPILRHAVHQCCLGVPSEAVLLCAAAIEDHLRRAALNSRNYGTGLPRANSIDTLPQHQDYLLILHQPDCGTAAEMAAVMALTAPILIIHYTHGAKAEFLRRWQPFAAVALGADAMAAVALQAAGFRDPYAVILSPAPSITEARFTILVPGDIGADSPALADIAAFATVHRRCKRPARLVLLGRTLDARMAKAVQDRIADEGLRDAVIITGATDAASRRAWLAQASLCLTPGPMPDGAAVMGAALQAGVPVSTRPAAGAPACAAMLAALDPDRARALSVTQDAAWRIARGAAAERVLWNALGQCGVGLPTPPEARTLIRDHAQFAIAGHLSGTYSIAAVNRLLAAALEARCQGGVRVVPVQFRRLDQIEDVPGDEQVLMQKLLNRRPPPGGPVVAVSQHVPPWAPDFPNDLALALFAWEESRIPAAIIQTLNDGFAGVLAVSAPVAKALVESGLRVPVVVTGQAIALAAFQALAQRRAARAKPPVPGDRFVFLHVSSCFPRKGVDVLLAAWTLAFNAGDPVSLVIKGFANPHNDVPAQVARLGANFPDAAAIDLVMDDLPQAALLALYEQADCMVLPTRGEGFNMVAAEAMAAGLPLIVTGYGGHMDALDAGAARLLDFHFAPSRSHVASPGSLWVEPAVDDLVAALREAFEDWRTGGARLRRRAARAVVHAARLDAGGWAGRVVDAAAAVFAAPATTLRRVAWVSSWGVRCGIAEYARMLLQHRPLARDAPAILVLSDLRSQAATDLPDADGVAVAPCWQVGSGTIARDITPALVRFEPDILVIQHQDGLIGWEDLIDLIDLAHGLRIRTMIALHATAQIDRLDIKLQAAIWFSLARVERVLVHTVLDVENLRRRGLMANVALLPHGARPILYPTPQPAAGQARGAGPVLGCYGFLLPHKGIATLIAAFATLCRRWPHARLRLVNAHFGSALSEQEQQRCRVLARELAVDGAVEWHTRYLAEAESVSLLAECDLIVMPYGDTPESASGAVRLALLSGAPVAVAQIPLFAELGDAVHRVDARSAHSLSVDVERLLADEACRWSRKQAAIDWLREHDWGGVAARLFGLAAALLRQPGAFNAPLAASYPANSAMLHRKVGILRGTRLRLTGESAGYGVFGPYIRLPAGHYRLMYRFDDLRPPRGCARFEVCSAAGEHVIAMLEIDFIETRSQDAVVETNFALDGPAFDVEFRVYCEAGFEAAFLGLSIHALPGAGA